MKAIRITAILCILAAALLGGCRDRSNTETMPSATRATAAPTQAQTTPTTHPATKPIPSIPMPEGSDANPGSQPSNGILDPESRMPHHRGPRR